MTELRDLFAAHALTGLLAQTDSTESGHPCPRWCGHDEYLLSEIAYRYADAMMQARITSVSDARGKP